MKRPLYNLHSPMWIENAESLRSRRRANRDKIRWVLPAILLIAATAVVWMLNLVGWIIDFL